MCVFVNYTFNSFLKIIANLVLNYSVVSSRLKGSVIQKLL